MTTDATDQSVLDVLTDVLAALGAERDVITPEATFQMLDIDSLDLAELAQIIDERYGVQIAAGDVAQIETVGDLVAVIESRA